MYHVEAIGLTSLLLYLLSFSAYRNGLISKASHRKAWNILLAGSFLFAALAGIFLALQASYKWEIQFVKPLLKWHVEFGIALAFTGSYHLIFHLPYFFGRKESFQPVDPPVNNSLSGKEAIRNNLLVIGFVSTSVQLLLMREVLNLAGGYELISGIFLASWLTGSAAGSTAARYSGVNDIRKLNFLFGTAIVISLLLIPLLSGLFLEKGETPSFFLSVIYTVIVLLPFTFISGFTFTRILIVASAARTCKPGSSFSIETAGGIIGGITVTILSHNLLGTYQLLAIILILYFFYWITTFISGNPRVLISTLSAAIILVIAVIFLKPDVFMRGLLMQGIKVTRSADTQYGNITTGEYSGEQAIYYNQRLLAWSGNEAEREENVHYAMLQHPDPKKVLVISGDLNAIIQEVQKYNPDKITYVERDPGLLAILKENSKINSSGVTIINADPYRYMTDTGDSWDVILMLEAPPSTLLLNRMYTTDFFRIAALRLKGKGIFMCSPGPGENYFNTESRALYSSIYNSMASAFRNVVPVIGNRLYLIASDDSVSTGICSLVDKRGIRNTYVSSDFLADDIIKSRSSAFLSGLDPAEKSNTLDFPVACLWFQNYNLSRSLTGLVPVLILIIVLFIMPSLTVRRRHLPMYFSAAALAGFEIIALVLLQSSAGNIYQGSGLIIASAMAGLAAGAGINRVFFPRYRLYALTAVMFIVYFSYSFVVDLILESNPGTPVIFIISTLVLVPAFFTGQLFRVLSESLEDDKLSGLYSADLKGSALCFALTAGVAVPAAWLHSSVLIIAGFALAALLSVPLRGNA